MNSKIWKRWLILVALGGLPGLSTMAVTNTVPWWDAFEGYGSGMDLDGSNGWSGMSASAGTATTNPAVVGLLAGYPVGGKSYPLSTSTHTSVLRTVDAVWNSVRSESNGLVRIDFMALPEPVVTTPAGKTNVQSSFFVLTNGNMAVWCRGSAMAEPTWVEVTPVAPVATGAWCRFTLVQDYSSHLFRLSVNETILTNGAGWTGPGGSQPGPWFYMVQTNGVMAQINIGEDGTNYVDDLVVDFGGAATLNYGAVIFNETPTNNGTVSGTTLALVNKVFNATQGEDLVAGGKVVTNGLPSGLGLRVIRGETAQEAVLVFTGAATAHAAGNSTANLGLTFTDDAFVLGNAAGVANAARSDLAIQFRDPRSLAYSGGVFTEISGGAIDNRNPLTITLTGDTFAGTNGQDLVAAGWVGLDHLPLGLSAQMLRTSATQLTVSLTGYAANNETNYNVSDLTFTFLNGVFVDGWAEFVGGYQNTSLQVVFTNDTGFFNVMQYRESFEGYPVGLELNGTNGWSEDYAYANRVTNNSALTADEQEYLQGHMALPIATTHTKILGVQDTVRTKIHTEGAALSYLDFMALPVPVEAAPEGKTNLQYAFYVNTNAHLVIWHRAAGGNEWLEPSGNSLVDTSKWTRFTVAQDHQNRRYQVRINEGAPVSDMAGWSDDGSGHPGSWFKMVRTNASMEEFAVSGTGQGYLDDLTVLSILPPGYGQGIGSVYKFR